MYHYITVLHSGNLRGYLKDIEYIRRDMFCVYAFIIILTTLYLEVIDAYITNISIFYESTICDILNLRCKNNQTKIHIDIL